jgi:glycosyltransferase involved in cell wall biosynthesis
MLAPIARRTPPHTPGRARPSCPFRTLTGRRCSTTSGRCTTGVDANQWPAIVAAPDHGETLVSFGRIHPDKATADAIEIARLAGRPLTICGPIHDATYFRERVELHIDGERVRYLGNVGGPARAAILGGAGVLLHPLGFDEPFGLCVVEAMMCGTPVVAYRRGAMPEVIDEGQTGFLVDTVDEAAAAVPGALSIDRSVVAATARRRFSADRMVGEYLSVYQQLLDRQ